MPQVPRPAVFRPGRGCVLGGAITAVLALLLLVFLLMRPALVSQGERTIDSTTLGSSFGDIAELATEEFVFSEVGKFDDEGLRLLGVWVPFTGKNFLVSYEGRVTAGIKDTGRIGVDVDEEAGAITVRVPQVEVLETHVDADSAQVWDQTMNPLNQLKVSDVTEFISSREDAAEQKAIDHGLLDRARSQAEQLMVNHAKALTAGTAMQDYNVDVEWIQ